LVLEAGLLTTILWSMAIRRPFTVQYRWLKAPHDPILAARAHTLLTAVWASCYAVMAAINAVSVILHQLSPGWAGIAGLVVFAATLTFTWQFGAYIDRRGGNAPLPGRK
jgi:predicted Co/Zn/Cd cation transporter (cation efflux family)